MNKQQHRIFRLQFDLRIPDSEIPGPIQDRISAIIDQRLFAILEKVFCEFTDPAVLIVLERLELDLGNILINEMEKQLPEQVETLLRQQLAHLLKFPVPDQPQFQKRIVPNRDLEILETFLLKGAYPWWLSPDKYFSPGELLLQLLENDLSGLKGLLQRISGLKSVSRRIAATYNDRELMQLIQLLPPARVDFLQKLVVDLTEQFQLNPLPRLDRLAFRVLLWELVLAFTLPQLGELFKKQDLVVHLLNGFMDRLGEIGQHSFLVFLDGLLTLPTEHPSLPLNQQLPARKQVFIEVEESFFPDWMNQVILAWPIEDKNWIKEQLLQIEKNDRLPDKQLLKDLAAVKPQVFTALLYYLSLKPWFSKQMCALFPDEELLQMIKLLCPKHLNLIERLLADLQHSLLQLSTLSTGQLPIRSLLWEPVLKVVVRPHASNFGQQEIISHIVAGLRDSVGSSILSKLIEISNVEQAADPSNRSLSPFYRRAINRNITRTEKDITIFTTWIDDFLVDFPPKQRARVRERLLELEENEWVLPDFSLWGIRFWQRFVRQLWTKQPQAIHRLVEVLVNTGGAADAYLLNFPPEVSRKLIAHDHSELSGPLNILERELVWLARRNLLPGWTASQVHKTITLFFLTRLIGPTANWWSSSQIMKSFLHLLATRRAQSSTSWFAGILDQVVRLPKNSLSPSLLHMIWELSGGTHAPQEVEANASDEWINETIINDSSNEAIAHLARNIGLVQDFFISEMLPSGTSLTHLWDWISIWLRHSPSSLKEWLYARLYDPGFSDRMATFLPQKISAAILDLLHYPAGASTLQWQIILTEMGLLKYGGLSVKDYWWASWGAMSQKLPLSNFSLSGYFTDILKNLATRSSISVEEWLSKLGETSDKEQSAPRRILRTVAIVQQWERIFQDRSPEFATLSIDQKTFLLDIVLIITEEMRLGGSFVPAAFPEELFGQSILKGLTQSGDDAVRQRILTEMLAKQAVDSELTFSDYLQRLLPVLQYLGPVLQHGLSQERFMQVIRDNLEVTMPKLDIVAHSNAALNSGSIGSPKIKSLYRKLLEKESADTSTDQAEVWLVANAGMVLVWPYLGVFFERAGLMKDGHFVDEAHQQRAVYLLEYLVSGESAPEEYKLLLNKLLCAWPMEAPLTVGFTVGDQLTELCEGLLRAVISHWSVIGDISIDALRETFLLREGYLARTPKGWFLQIPQKSYDILLTELPWGISVVNLSWTDTLLEVEWGLK
ncbi:contractile injection system tape measure protein [Flavilitoribacter nigricans]|uniref:Uncharacterized protein n=1 Tax=Flavilitoribacter nigricans (strain ATCC 23147 / DSM 23189 / NBRC 102662 / NCIMB 1420 / SS-2) TaxID=1122177 RepID=A0A2D0N149_FLAN2|nr:contractile injection system tape measure protein [Flavilitoribacter nigricans]PHN02225.1 hypothetical protein CRP01_33360 [Flavilitoribacter nigricans DSM 23189 = NBRC 102662]